MATDIISAYRSVCRDLTALEAYEPVLRARMEASHRVVFKGKMPSSEMCYVPLNTSLPVYEDAALEHEETDRTIKQLRKVKQQIEKIIFLMSEAEQIVILMHVEQGMHLKDIADQSHYSYGYLRNVARQLKAKDMTKCANAS